MEEYVQPNPPASKGGKIIGFLVLIIIALLSWRFWPTGQQYANQLSSGFENFASSTMAATLQDVTEKIFTPPPLRSAVNHQDASLSVAGVISWTNAARKENGNLPALKENSRLNAAAQAKVDDMFRRQYFEHKSPSGQGPADLARAAGYIYIAIGENLALGNYKNDQALVDAWMNSPGHRANILHAGFEEIGVAVGQGMYEGKKTWLAVQEFGRPASSCPSVDKSLKSEINSLQAEVDFMNAQLNQIKAELDSMHPQTQSDYDAYNQKVREFYDLVKIYNNKVDILKLDTANYNAQVNSYNACLNQ